MNGEAVNQIDGFAKDQHRVHIGELAVTVHIAALLDLLAEVDQLYTVAQDHDGIQIVKLTVPAGIAPDNIVRILGTAAGAGAVLEAVTQSLAIGFTAAVAGLGRVTGSGLPIMAQSLAVGLSDVVQNQSGNVRLEMLFIDEGFGSLDESALQRAMELLSRLSDGKRTIGVISHVAELRERIPKKLLVLHGPSGSRIESEY